MQMLPHPLPAANYFSCSASYSDGQRMEMQQQLELHGLLCIAAPAEPALLLSNIASLASPCLAGFSRTAKHSAPERQRRGSQFSLQANGFRSAHGMQLAPGSPVLASRCQRPKFEPDGVAMLLCDVTLGVPGPGSAKMRRAAPGCHSSSSGPTIHAVYLNDQARRLHCFARSGLETAQGWCCGHASRPLQRRRERRIGWPQPARHRTLLLTLPPPSHAGLPLPHHSLRVKGRRRPTDEWCRAGGRPPVQDSCDAPSGLAQTSACLYTTSLPA